MDSKKPRGDNTVFVVYNKATTVIVKSKRHGSFKSLGAAKAHLTRMGKMGYRVEDHAVSEAVAFRNIEKTEERTNLMSGKKFTQSVNTPRCCDPSSELYWSM